MKSRFKPAANYSRGNREMGESFRKIASNEISLFAHFRNVVCTDVLYKTVHLAGENDNARRHYSPSEKETQSCASAVNFRADKSLPRSQWGVSRDELTFGLKSFRSDNNWQPASIPVVRTGRIDDKGSPLPPLPFKSCDFFETRGFQPIKNCVQLNEHYASIKKKNSINVSSTLNSIRVNLKVD